MEIDFSRVVDVLPGLVWTALPDGRADFVNQRWCEYTGLSFDEACGEGWQGAVHLADRPGLLERWRAIAAANEPAELEARLRRADGEYRWFLLRISPIAGASGAVARWCGVSTDIEDRKWAEVLLAGEKRLLSMVAQGVPLAEVLGTLCQVVEDAAPGRLCSVLSIDPDGVRFRHGAGPSLPAAYNEVVDGLIMDHSYGPCGMAANQKTQVIAEDVGSDPRWAASPWPALVLGHGLRSCWSTPILSRDDKVIGVFALYQTEPARPSEREHELIRQFTQIAGVAIERARSEEDLRRSSAYLAEAQRLSLTGSFFWRPETDEITVSREFRRIHGLAADQVVTLEQIRELFHPDDAAFLSDKIAEARRGGADLDYEVRLRMPDGSTKHLHTVSQSIQGPDGRLEIIGAVQDITERRLSEEALRRSTAFLAEAQQISATGSFSWRVATGEIAWSEQVYRMFEYDIGTPITLQLLGARVHPEDRPLLDDMVESARRGVPDFEYEHRLLLPDGSIKHLHLMAHGRPDQRGQMEYIGAVQEVTERRVSEQALSRVRSALTHMARVNSLGALTASIAHEVSQPLSGIITNASTCLRMLAADPPNIAGAQETARRTVRDGNRAADIIKRLRTLFAKRDAASEPVDLNEAAREVIALSANDLQRSRVIVRLELADGLPPVTGDRVQLQQVILNLLLNAADAMKTIEDRPRLLTIRTAREDGDSVRLTMRDAGVGFDPQATARLFDAFYTTKSEGMGIGLSISRSIVENHGGRLWAEADDGPGATFAFSIPCSSADTASAGGSQPLVRPAEPQVITVQR